MITLPASRSPYWAMSCSKSSSQTASTSAGLHDGVLAVGGVDVLGVVAARDAGHPLVRDVIIITGAASGIGRACIDLMRRACWRSVGIDLNASDTDLSVHGCLAQSQPWRSAWSWRVTAARQGPVITTDRG
jgi:hypothetical protein